MNSFKQVIKLWGPVEVFAEDLGITLAAAWAWHTRDSIPSEWFLRVVKAAASRGFQGVSLDLLATLAEQRPRSNSSARTERPADQAA